MPNYENPPTDKLVGFHLRNGATTGFTLAEAQAARLKKHLDHCNDADPLFYEIDSADPFGVFFVNLQHVACVAIKSLSYDVVPRKQDNIVVRFANGAGALTFEPAETEDVEVLAHSINYADNLNQFLSFQSSNEGDVLLRLKEIAYVALPSYG